MRIISSNALLIVIGNRVVESAPREVIRNAYKVRVGTVGIARQNSNQK